MEGHFLFIIFAIVAVVIVVLSIFFSNKAIVKRKLKKSETKRISYFRSGEVGKIAGKVEFVDHPLVAPLSKRKCACYHIEVEQKVSSGKSSHWKTIIEEEVTNKFVLRDGLDCACVNDRNIKSYIVEDREYSSGLWNDATANLESYLQSKGYESENFLGLNKKLRYREGVLEQGEVVAVFGRGDWKDATALNYPEEYGRLLAFSSLDGEPVYLSDDPETSEGNK